MSVRQAHPVIARPRSSIEPPMVDEGSGIMFSLWAKKCGILVKLGSFLQRTIERVRVRYPCVLLPC